MANDSIEHILNEWEFDPEALAARILVADDGREVLQIRVELGVVQLELTGRPDGRRPEGCESLLAYHQQRVAETLEQGGGLADCRLAAAACAALRDESALYYQRYVTLYHLGRFEQVVRDTARNLACCRLLAELAVNPEDAWELLQYQPYITMMHALAKTELLVADYDFDGAIANLRGAIEGIRDFAANHAGRIQVDHEVELLHQRRRAVEQDRPASPGDLLLLKLEDAILREDYEAAARLRDEISRAAGPPPPALDD